jgi:agrin
LKNGEGAEINCGSGPYRNNCPSGSFCHRGHNFAKCCKKEERPVTTTKPFVPISHSHSCEGSLFGCCPDGKTQALGENNGGCPSVCLCNKLGSIRDTCDPYGVGGPTCQCKSGVGGARCDSCLPGYWGLSRRSSEGSKGGQGCKCRDFN